MPKQETHHDIRLIALDLDDTLLGSDLKVSPQSRKAIREAMDKGITVTLATGRMFRSAQVYARELGITAPLITYNGALIRAVGEAPLRHSPVPAEEARELAEMCRREGLSLNVYLDDTLYVAEMNEDVEYYLSIAGVEVTPVGDLAGFLAENAWRTGSTKMLICSDKERIDHWLPALKERYGGRLYLARSKARFIEILSPGVDKGKAMAFLTGRLGVSPEQVMAVGDSENDIEMLRFAGLGVAVGNAPPHVKAEADYVAEGRAGDGVAEAIERLAL